MNKKMINAACAGLLALSLAGCSSAPKESAKESSAAARVEAVDYEETFDVSTAEFETAEFHGMTYEMVKGWSGRKMSQDDDAVTYLISGQKDVIELHFTSDDPDTFLKDVDASVYGNVVSTEDKDIAGTKGKYVQATTTVASSIIEDANCDLYLIPTSEGTIIVRFTIDPNGKIDYQPVVDHLLETAKLA